MAALVFREEDHSYWVGERRLVNVTRVIAHLTDFSHIPPDTLAHAQQEGKAIHAMAELDCKGVLDVRKLPEWLKPRHAAWEKFKSDTGFECFASEHRMWHPALMVAGTLDMVGFLPQLPKVKGPAIIDLKRSLYAGPATGLQLAGYKKLWNDTEPKDMRATQRFGLVLNDNGTYRLHEFSDPDDEVAFIACLQQFKWKEKHYVRRPAIAT